MYSSVVGQARDANYAVAGGLGARGDDAHLLTDEGIQESRFADVGAADECSEAAMEFGGRGL